jgi:hypothetical protein
LLPEISPLSSDVELVDLTDTQVYVRLTPEAYLHAVAHELRLELRSGDSRLVEIALDGLSAQQTHLAGRAGTGIRTAPVDLVSALAGHGGVARDVEILVTSPGSVAGFERSLGILDVLAAGTAATPDLLAELPVSGAVEGLDGGWIRAWYRTAGPEPLSLHIAGEMVALRAEPADDGGQRSISFRAGHLVADLGYGARSDDQLSIRVPGTNVPLPGRSLTVRQVRTERAAAAAWARLRRPPVVVSVVRRLRRRGQR